MTKPISNAQLAREMLEKAVSKWQKSPQWQTDLDFFISDLDGEINIGLALKTAYGQTTIIFNPQSTVEELAEACQRRLERSGLWENERLREKLLRTQINGSIKIMLAAIRNHFEDSIWELPLVISTLYDLVITPPDLRRSLIDDLLDHIVERKKKRLEVKGRGRRRAIIDETVYLAIKNMGSKPSQRAVSRFLGISEKTLREWRKSKGFPTWEAFLEETIIGRK